MFPQGKQTIMPDEETAIETKPCAVLEALQNSTEEDVAAIDTRIAELEAELGQTTERIKGEIASLKAAKRLIECRLHGKPAKPQRKPRQAAAVATSGTLSNGRQFRGNRRTFASGQQPNDESENGRLSSRIMNLLKHQGPMAIQVIANRLEEPLQAVAVAVVHSSGLKREGDKVSLVQSLLPA
jgi:hypothetical protein